MPYPWRNSLLRDGACRPDMTAREMTDGGPIEADADRHPHPIAEAIRWQICEGELVQIIGRPRGVNRTAENPVDILVMTNVVLPMPIDEILQAADLDPAPAELMLAAGGVAFENPTDAATAYPSLWKNREAAKKALQRREAGGRLGTNPYRESSYTSLSPTSAPDPSCLRRVDYQVAGAGRRSAIAWTNPALVPDPAATLTEKLGPLAWCRPATAAQPEAPARAGVTLTATTSGEPPAPRPKPPAPRLILFLLAPSAPTRAIVGEARPRPGPGNVIPFPASPRHPAPAVVLSGCG